MTLSQAFKIVVENSPPDTLVNVKHWRTIGNTIEEEVFRCKAIHIEFKLPHMKCWGHAGGKTFEAAVQDALARVRSNVKNHARKMEQERLKTAPRFAQVC